MNIEEVLGEQIIGVRVTYFDEQRKHSFEKIEFVFDKHVIIVSLDKDTDEIVLNTKLSFDFMTDEQQVPEWSKDVIGKKLQSFWRCYNDQEYFDLFILGLDKSYPVFSIYCGASQLFVGSVSNE